LWQIELTGSSRTPANAKAIEALLDALQGRRDVLAFKDVPDAEAAKVRRGPRLRCAAGRPAAVYLGGIDNGKDAKKDEPALKKDAKPAVSWQFGKTDKDQGLGEAQAWRTAPRPASRSTNPALEKNPAARRAARLSRTIAAEDQSERHRENSRSTAAAKIVALEKKNDRWMLKRRGRRYAGRRSQNRRSSPRVYSGLEIRRWVKKLDPKDDRELFGLKSPGTDADAPP